LERPRGAEHSLVRTTVLDDVTKKRVHDAIFDNVAPGANLYTDESVVYKGLKYWGYIHDVVNHAETYVKGRVHTNGLENFWSLVKRAIHGTYVSIEPFHVFRYLDEQAYRFNNRKTSDGERFRRLLRDGLCDRLTYAELTGRATQPA
jgi:hypothetical protein